MSTADQVKRQTDQLATLATGNVMKTTSDPDKRKVLVAKMKETVQESGMTPLDMLAQSIETKTSLTNKGDDAALAGFQTMKLMGVVSEIWKFITKRDITGDLATGGSGSGSGNLANQLANQLANKSLADVKGEAIGSWIYGNKMYDRNSPMTSLIAQKLEHQYTTNAFRKAMAVSLSITGDQMSASTMFKEANKEDMLYRNDSLKYTMAKQVLNDPHANDDSVAQSMDVILNHTMKYGAKAEILAFAQILSTSETNKANAMKYMGGRYSSDNKLKQELMKMISSFMTTNAEGINYDKKNSKEQATALLEIRNRYFKPILLAIKNSKIKNKDEAIKKVIEDFGFGNLNLFSEGKSMYDGDKEDEKVKVDTVKELKPGEVNLGGGKVEVEEK